MKSTTLLSSLLCGSIVFAAIAAAGVRQSDKPSVVRVTNVNGAFTLLRDGKPFFIRGAGGTDELPLLKQLGGNSIRTWGADHLQADLDKAEAQGLCVCAGIWLGQERQGFRYDDPKAVADQLENARKVVRKFRGHPALLMWGLGNEMEGDGDNPAIWKAIEDIAKMVKLEDPNHPTLTVLAEIGGRKIPNLNTYCPDIDILGINSYGGLRSLPRRLKEAGWKRPYVVTEFGPLGQWEGGYTPWKAPIEMTSTEKANWLLSGYLLSIEDQKNWCLGSYVFLWGHKQEVTHTWYSMLLPFENGLERLDTADAVSYGWTGKWPANRAPSILTLETNATNREVAPGAVLTAAVAAQDPDGDPLRIVWEVRSETNDRKVGGDAENVPQAHPECIVEAKGRRVTFKAPTAPGPYRLFVVIHDGKGGAAAANVCFLVK